MCRALAALPCTPDMALVDGNDPPPLPCAAEAVVKGDATDRVDRGGLDRRQGGARPPDAAPARALPGLRLRDQRGLPHRRPLAALREGPCPFHRRSFAPVRQGALDLSEGLTRPAA